MFPALLSYDSSLLIFLRDHYFIKIYNILLYILIEPHCLKECGRWHTHKHKTSSSNITIIHTPTFFRKHARIHFIYIIRVLLNYYSYFLEQSFSSGYILYLIKWEKLAIVVTNNRVMRYILRDLHLGHFLRWGDCCIFNRKWSERERSTFLYRKSHKRIFRHQGPLNPLRLYYFNISGSVLSLFIWINISS